MKMFLTALMALGLVAPAAFADHHEKAEHGHGKMKKEKGAKKEDMKKGAAAEAGADAHAAPPAGAPAEAPAKTQGH